MKNLTDPLISIITVVYNSHTLLENTIKSIINQVYKNIEYIIIDGGSTDGTVEIIKKYERYIDFWLSEKDEGIYSAMNKGLQNSNGDYVLFINSGDQLNNSEIITKILTKNQNADCYYGKTILVDSDGKELMITEIPKDLTWKSMFYGMVISHQSIIFRRSLIGKYNLKYKMVSDFDWIIKGLKKSRDIVRINFPISRYLLGGISDKNFKICWKERIQITNYYFGKYTMPYSLSLYLYAIAKKKVKLFLRYFKNTENI